MKKILIYLVLIAFFTPDSALATEEAATIDHYEGQHFESASGAIRSLHENAEKIHTILDASHISGQDLEYIHEISYTLEAAVDKLIAIKASNAHTLETLDEAVQAIHFSSENHKEPETREWLPKLVSAIDALDKNAGQDNPKKDIYDIVIKDHKFSPETLTVPAGQKIKLIIDNQDPTPEEFESHDLNREKIIPGNSTANIFIGPLKPGTYKYFGEFNMDSANGVIIAE